MGDAGSPELAVEDLHNMFEAVEESQAACGQVTPGSDTEFLSSIPGMRTSIKKGMQEPLESSAKHLDW